ncbi:MAG: helix-turn-helix domain-containing protein [Tepidisphaeraceae bacterium]
MSVPPAHASALSAPSPAFVDFVLRHAQVKTNPGTRQKWETPYTLLPRIVPDYNLIFLTRGRAVWELIDGPTYALSPGDLLVVPPGPRHRGYSTTRRMTLGSIHFEVTLPGGQDVFSLLVPAPVRHVQRGSRLDRYLRGCFEEFDRNDDAHAMLMMPGWSRLVALELIRYDARHGLLRRRAVDPLIADMLEELDRRIERPTDLRELARLAGFTPQHLNRVFRRSLGFTPLQYLNRMRLERAAVLLADGRLTVRAVANRSGFADPYYFSRQFRAHFGRSPAQYREAADASAPPAGIGSNSPS